ncbi:HSP20-like chaperone [Roridomyces roridus]|uniref:HSP20-like chaperone n=1 Tax=Roridomyces roridus TaxID=1738132 RepID=A0AAD7BZ18_9AGAR|nr:HSP20-like chaperone [Roridomyces roridus]
MSKEQVAYIFEAIRTGRLRVQDKLSNDAVFRPRMEMYDNPSSPRGVATFELPGVKIGDLDISAKRGLLIVKGHRRARYQGSSRHPSLRGVGSESVQDDVNKRYFPHQELRYGSFYRKLRLPPGADTSRIQASMSDGLLTVTWPRLAVIENVDNPGSVTADEESVQGAIAAQTTSYVRSAPSTL